MRKIALEKNPLHEACLNDVGPLKMRKLQTEYFPPVLAGSGSAIKNVKDLKSFNHKLSIILKLIKHGGKN